jgi:hypothetical protein
VTRSHSYVRIQYSMWARILPTNPVVSPQFQWLRCWSFRIRNGMNWINI